MYPSVSADVLNKSINFATFFVSIEGSIINTRKHARNSLPLDENGSWLKKHRDSFDSAEVCELNDLYLLDESSKV